MANVTIIDQQIRQGQYDLPCTIAIIDHPEHGRLLMSEGFGGMDGLEGGAYRWRHGLACKLQPDDTLASLAAGNWNQYCDLIEAIMQGADGSRPLMIWPGSRIAALAQSAGI